MSEARRSMDDVSLLFLGHLCVQCGSVWPIAYLRHVCHPSTLSRALRVHRSENVIHELEPFPLLQSVYGVNSEAPFARPSNFSKCYNVIPFDTALDSDVAQNLRDTPVGSVEEVGKGGRDLGALGRSTWSAQLVTTCARRAHLEAISTLGRAKHFDITACSLDEVEDDARRGRRALPAAGILDGGSSSLSIRLDAPWKI